MLFPIVAIADDNLVQNAGFEASTTSGCPDGIVNCPTNWTWTGGTDYTGISTDPHSGSYSFQLAEVYAFNTDLSQTLSTIVGAPYQISFYLKFSNASLDGPSYFNTKFGGTDLLTLHLQSAAPSFPYTHYTYTTKAGSTADSLLFSAYATGSNSYFFLDDISVTRVGPAPADTQSSMQYQATQLRSAFNTQSIAANFALNYDCNVFGKNGLCTSAGARSTIINNPGINDSATLLTLGYKVNPNIRIGTYLDQNVNVSHSAGLRISNNTPLMGIYAVWNKQQNGLGYQLRLANTYQKKDVISTRAIFNTSEPGTGESAINSRSYLAELSYALQYQDRTLIRPYFGLRYTRLKKDGYTENSDSTVTDPLTVNSLSDKSIAALLGMKLNYKLTEKTTLLGSLGLEQDLYHSIGDYSATDPNASSLTPIKFNSDSRRTHLVAMTGAHYDINKAQRASATINYQQLQMNYQQPQFQSTSSVTGYINYTIGF